MSNESPKQTILAVDDAPENLDVVKGILTPEYIVKAAVNGKMALKIAMAQPPDLILLDIMMPEMDGCEVCRQLMDNETTRDIPVIFLTGKDQDEARSFELGAVDHLIKPISHSVLQARIRTHLAQFKARKQLATQNKEPIKAAGLIAEIQNGEISLDT